MPALKPAYLIHGDDHGRIAERRANLRTLAERESGANGLEVLEGEDATAERVVAALTALTFAIGPPRRHRRRGRALEGRRRRGRRRRLPGPDDDITVAFFAREEGRQKVPAGLVKAVEKAGGDVRAEATVKPWELPKWAQARARELGLDLPNGPARVLVRLVGERQQRVLRELEKLALALPAAPR